MKSRRSFLKRSFLGGALSWTAPTFVARTFSALEAEAAAAVQPVTGRDGNILVLVQMAGGNDGLNTVVPFANDHYLAARPGLRLRGTEVSKLNDEVGLHPALSGFQSLYDEGALAVVQGVGYPNPNRSHFRSTEIWQTASDAQRFEKHGWVGRYFDHACPGCDPTIGISIGRQMPQSFSAQKPVGISLEDAESYRFMVSDRPEAGEGDTSESSFRQLNQTADEIAAGGSIEALPGRMTHVGSALDFLERTAVEAQASSDRIRAIERRGRTVGNYPAGKLGASLKLVASLIGGGLPTRVFYVSQGGYDTHAHQGAAHHRLLGDLGTAVQAFMKDMALQGNASRVLLMTFSEFGRRLAENASAGTDHGAAAPLFLVGPKVKAGLTGKHPSLAREDLLNGDPRFSIDFRGVLATILERWLGTSSRAVLGRDFPVGDLLI